MAKRVWNAIEPLKDKNDWVDFRNRFTIYLREEERHTFEEMGIPNEKNNDRFRLDKFYLALGPVGQAIFKSLFPDADDRFARLTLDKVKDAFTEHFTKDRNITRESFKFSQMRQEKDQSFRNFYLNLRLQAAECEFECSNCRTSYQDRMVRDQIVAGINSHRLQGLLIGKNESTIDVVKTCMLHFKRKR